MNNFRQNLLKNRDILSYLKKKLLTPLVGICGVSLILLVETSPVLSILWLCIPTLYFLYIRNYRSIFKIWGFTIGIWYLIFSTLLSNITILVGFENTKVILNYLSDNPVLFKSFCFQTVYLLDALSSKLGFSIHIPAIINIFGALFKFFNNDSTECSNAENSSDKKNDSSSFWSSFGGDSSTSKKSQSEIDMSRCESLARELEKTTGIFYSSTSTTDGKRTLTYSKSWIPGFGVKNVCHSRDATDLEKKLFGEIKKKNS